jgi:micrococcal nuclease
MKRLGGSILAALALAGCGPGLDQLAAGPTGLVAEVRNGDAVVLRGGQVVRLAGIEAPKGDDPFAGQAREALARLVLGQEVQLMFGGARQDAYGRTLAHLRLTRGGAWVEQALLQAGDARVHTYPDNRALGRAMLDAEARARRARRGLWAIGDYQVRLPDEAAARPFGFQVVEGRVTVAVQQRDGVRVDIERWVSAEAPTNALGAFAASGIRLEDLPGKLVRVRGLLRPGSGEALMKLDHPEQIEVLREPK